MKVQILEETPKGLLISDGERATWIMKRQRRADGTLTPGAVKALSEATTSHDDMVAKVAEQDDRRAAHTENCERPTHHLQLFSDYKLGTNRFCVTDARGKELWFGRDFDDPESQAAGELSAAKKAVWLAGKLAETLGDEARACLTLKVDAEYLCYQQRPNQKGYVLTKLAAKYGIGLRVEWVSGASNPADEQTAAKRGYQKWRDADLPAYSEASAA